jgi:hypothetical protein
VTPDVSEIQIEELLQIAKWINLVIMTGLTLSAVVIILRALRQGEFSIGQLKLKLKFFPYILVAMSLAHFFLSWMFIQNAQELLTKEANVRKLAWLKITTSDAFIFNNMQPRLWDPTAGPFSLGAYITPFTDTAMMASAVFALVAIVSVVTSLWPETSRPRVASFILHLEFGCAIAAANWLIGSRWAIALSSLLQ